MGYSPGNASLKMIIPRTAVSTKFALVLITLTRTVLLARVRARVKSPHITPLKIKFDMKKAYVVLVTYCRDTSVVKADRTPLTRNSTTTLGSSMPKR